MTDVKIIGVDEIVSGVNRMASSVQSEMMSVLQSAAEAVVVIMRNNISDKSGSLSASIDYSINGLEAEIGPNDGSFGGRPVGRAVELGRLPGGGFPNWFDIATRYSVSLSVGFAIAKSIQQKGTPGLGFVEKTEASVSPIFEKYGMEAIYNIVNRF